MKRTPNQRLTYHERSESRITHPIATLDRIATARGCLMLCPWCMHYGPEDAEYAFDGELYCGICAQQMPRGQAEWDEAYRQMDPAWYEHVERELNKIISSRSGLPPEMREAIGTAVDAYRDKRVGKTQLPISEDEYANWFKFACTYFAPGE